MTTKAEYRKLLFDGFPKLKIGPALFYNSDYGLRFDLQKKEPDTEDYFDEAVKRAVTLFKACFSPADDVFLIYRKFKRNRGKISLQNCCFRQLQNLKINGMSFIDKKTCGKSGRYHTALIKTNVEEINYKNIFTAIANTDFPPRQPTFMGSEEVFFINITTKLIFYMYDDRGLDIVAPSKEVLLPLYVNFNDWILDYDKTHIDYIFKY